MLQLKVTELNESINKLTDKIEEGNERYNLIDKRVAKVEFFLFENKAGK